MTERNGLLRKDGVPRRHPARGVENRPRRADGRAAPQLMHRQTMDADRSS
eukprot:CAMPEP_0197899886 /NCGR_PEP_ID=MMETSP1439-20131203/47677_1 /TAXON_ID=66791 /ORGANISM="Gonyaulax spinifera, Strain CCMP409" /LENGTH=49 /DNA_ID= /DNA_START= /DNA_END= /DNA_ORIENTATION=